MLVCKLGTPQLLSDLIKKIEGERVKGDKQIKPGRSVNFNLANSKGKTALFYATKHVGLFNYIYIMDHSAISIIYI